MILLIGHGYVGHAIARALRSARADFAWHYHESWDPDDADIIINAAGYVGTPNVDACETQRMACFEGNVLWPLEVERRSGYRPVIHIGSGCLYHGAGPFRETDTHNFDGSIYSFCKGSGELALRPYLHKSYVLRMRMPFGREAHPKNLLTKLCQYPKLVDYTNSLSCVEDAAEAVVHFARYLPPAGIYNLTNPGAVSTREIADLMGLRKPWFRDEAEFLATVKAPRSACVLDTRKLEAVFKMRSVQAALKDCIGTLRQRKAA